MAPIESGDRQMVKVGFAIGLALAVGLFVGIWGFFIPGIENIVNGINAEPDADAGKIAWGLAQVWILASPIGYLAGGLTYALFHAILGLDD